MAWISISNGLSVHTDLQGGDSRVVQTSMPWLLNLTVCLERYVDRNILVFEAVQNYQANIHPCEIPGLSQT